MMIIRYGIPSLDNIIFLFFIIIWQIVCTYWIRMIILLVVGSCQGIQLTLLRIWPIQLIHLCFLTEGSSLKRSILHRLSKFHKKGSQPAMYFQIRVTILAYQAITNSLSCYLNLNMPLLPMNNVFKTVHIDSPSSF